MKIEIPETFMGAPVKGAIERVLAEEKKKPEITQNPKTPIISSGDCWQVPGVEYRNGIYTINLLKALLDSGNDKTQDDWIRYSLEAKSRGDFYAGSMPLQYALFRALSSQDTQDALEAREFIKKQMREKWLMTTTRLRYNPSGKDEIVHDCKMPEEFILEAGLIGKDKFIDSSDSKALEALILDSDVDRVNRVFSSINGTNAYIWRLNSKPNQVIETVAGFGADSVRAGLYCGWNPSYRDPSLGVFAVREAGGNAS